MKNTEFQKKGNWIIKFSSIKYDNPWISLNHHEVITPGGSNGIYGIVEFKNIAIGIIALDSSNNIYLVGQYRLATDEYSVEIPEGGCPIGTDPLKAAQRELQEETGLTAKIWSQFMELSTSNSVCNEKAIVFLAEELTQGKATPEDTEDLKIIKLPLKEAHDMVLNGQINDAISMAAILKIYHIQSMPKI